jgi:hypothetical protein
MFVLIPCLFLCPDVTATRQCTRQLLGRKGKAFQANYPVVMEGKPMKVHAKHAKDYAKCAKNSVGCIALRPLRNPSFAAFA